MNGEEKLKSSLDAIRSSATVKVLSIGFTVILLLVPTSMISSLMREREFRRDAVVQEINQKWGNQQTVTGPYFTVPYQYFFKDEKDNLKVDTRYLHLLPENISVSGNIDPQVRYRGIYEVVLYNTKVRITGNFSIPSLFQMNIDPEHVLWDKAVFSIGISDMRGIVDNILVHLNETAYKASPGLVTSDLASSGVHCVIPISLDHPANTFSLELNLNGSDQFNVIPVGETTRVHLTSAWASPSFTGAFLPGKRDITNQGFSADWNILHLNRNFPQMWKGNHYKVNEAAFGIKLLIPTDVYQKCMRLSKYAAMFIVFTFAAFFVSEIINKQRVHPIQYMLIGLAILLFYVLLISISEHLNFDWAYLLSVTAATLMITGYTQGILKNRSFTVTLAGLLIALYLYLYIVIQQEDFALIMGSIGLFLVLAAVMYITRKVNWYALGKEPVQSMKIGTHFIEDESQ